MGSFKEKLQNLLFIIKKYWIVILIGIIVAVLLIAYLAGLVTQLNASGNADIMGGEKQPIDKNIFENIRISFATATGKKTFLTFFMFIAIAGIGIYAIRKLDGGGTGDPDRNFNFSKKDTYGTSGWMTKKEMNEALDVKRVEITNGTILGALNNNVVSVAPIIRDRSKYSEKEWLKSIKINKHVCVIGASGSYKSRAYVRPYIFQTIKRGESLIITDPKGEMYEDMTPLLIKNGYHVKIFNLKDQEYSDSWDCLAEVTDENMAMIFCSVIIQNTGGAKGDHFWDNSEMNLLKAIVLYVTIENKKNNRPVTIAEVYRLLTTQTVTDLERMFKVLPQTHPAYVPYAIYAQAGENVRGNIVIGLSSRIQVFQSQVTKNITSFPEIDLTRPGREKCAYFCAISDQEATYTFLSSLFFAFLFIRLVKYADMYSKIPGKLDVPVNFCMDEFNNIGSIPDFEKKISTVRSRDINISVIIQSIPQLKNRYPNDVWQEIIGNCDTQLFLGCNEDMTAKYISDRSGVATIDIQSEQTVRKTFALAQVIPEYKKTESVGKRNVLTVDEVRTLEGNKALIIIRGEKILKVDKYDYPRHPMSKEMVITRISQHIPRWHRREMEAEADGYELRTEKRGGGTLYYFNPKTGIFYERTAFINADNIDDVQASIPKGDTVKVATDKTVGYQIVKDDEGITYVVNSQTGETRLYYGFDENGNLKEALPIPESDEPSEGSEFTTEADEGIVFDDAGADVFYGTAPPLFDDDLDDFSPVVVQLEPPTSSKTEKAKVPSSLSDEFDSLVGPSNKKGTATLEEEFINPSPSSASKRNKKTSFTDTATLGSATPVPEKPFDEPESAAENDDPTDIWSTLRAEICAEPDKSDKTEKTAKPDTTAKQNPTQPAKPGVAGNSAAHSEAANHSNPVDSPSAAKTGTSKPVQPKQKGSKIQGQKPKHNLDLFTLDNLGKKETKPKSKTPESIAAPVNVSDTTPAVDISADDLFEVIPSTNPLDYVPDNVADILRADSRRKDEAVPSVVQSDTADDEEIEELPPAMSAAEVLGELHVAKSKKSKKGKDKETGDKDRSDDLSVGSSMGRDEPGSDWDYAFVSSDELFD